MIDGVSMFQPAVAIGRKGTLFREAQAAVQSHPTHELGKDKMLRIAAHFPDAIVFALPVRANPVEHAPDFFPERMRNGRAVLIIKIDRIEQLAVDIDLMLVIGAVANSHRT